MKVDNDLETGAALTLSNLLSRTEVEHHPHSVKADSVLVAEGIPPIPAKLVE